MIFSFVWEKHLYIIHNFADDNTLSSFAKSVKFLVEILMAESHNPIKWFSENKMIANPDKFKSVISSIVHEVIRGNFKLHFFYEKILQAQKAQKDAYKQTKLKKTSKEKVPYSLIYILCFLCS